MAYKSRKHLAEEFDICLSTADKVINQIRDEIEAGRYPPMAVLDYDRNVRVLEEAFRDCMKYGTALRDVNTRKAVPAFRKLREATA